MKFPTIDKQTYYFAAVVGGVASVGATTQLATQLALRAGWIAQALTPAGGAVFCLTSYLASKYIVT